MNEFIINHVRFERDCLDFYSILTPKERRSLDAKFDFEYFKVTDLTRPELRQQLISHLNAYCAPHPVANTGADMFAFAEYPGRGYGMSEEIGESWEKHPLRHFGYHLLPLKFQGILRTQFERFAHDKGFKPYSHTK
ncbi:hypothetical protein KW805_00015 [Candidatus Pacearchaeota archaeon]|nr:hypothetical protein [Candidatus Pacearchaeota archaeon]